MLQDCREQVSSVTGEQCQNESSEPFQRFLEPRTLPLEESFQSDVDIPTAEQTTRQEIGIQCELLVSKNLPMVKSVPFKLKLNLGQHLLPLLLRLIFKITDILESVHTQSIALLMLACP